MSKNKPLVVAGFSKTVVALVFLIAVFGKAFAQPDERSVARMTELIAARPNSDNLYIQRGNVYLYLNKLAEALADAEKALSLNPKNSDVFLLRGKIKIKQQDSEGAIADISRAVRASPTGYPLAYLMRGELYEKKGDSARAYADYKKLGELTLNPKAPQGIARLEAKMKVAGINPAQALAGIKDDDRKQAQAAFQAADRHSGKLEWQLAIAEYGKAIAHDPQFAAAYAKRARLYGNNSEFDLALADYAEAIRLRPDDAESFAARGGLYYRYGKTDSALADYSEAIRLKPDFADAYLSRGRVYSTLDQENKAAADWEKFLTITPDSPNARLARDYLATLRRQPRRTTTGANTLAQSPLWNKVSVSIKPLDPLRDEINNLAAELKTNNVGRARKAEIFNRIEQNSTKILAAVNAALSLLSVEPESFEKTVIKKEFDKDVAAMKINLEKVEEERAVDLGDQYEANVKVMLAADAAFKNARTNDERQKHLLEIARIARKNKAIAEKVIAQYLKYSEDKTVWAKIVRENEQNLEYVESMKLKFDIEF